MVSQISAAEEVVDLSGLGDVREHLDRRVGGLARLPAQQVDVGAVFQAKEMDVQQPGELLEYAVARQGIR
jgi:hypothetical protein